MIFLLKLKQCKTVIQFGLGKIPTSLLWFVHLCDKTKHAVFHCALPGYCENGARNGFSCVSRRKYVNAVKKLVSLWFVAGILDRAGKGELIGVKEAVKNGKFFFEIQKIPTTRR